jgi:hypothetical protein
MAKPKKTPGSKQALRTVALRPALGADRLLGDIRALIEAARAQTAQAVNSAIVALYWHIGKRIREDVLGEKRAEYGETYLPRRTLYTTGFLVPLEAGEDQRADETGEGDFTLTGGEGEATDDAAPPEPAAARRAFFPSPVGLNLLVPGATGRLRVVVIGATIGRRRESPGWSSP